MVARRLSEFQPEHFAFTPENQAWAEATIGKYPQGREASAIIPLLWRAQEQEGWVTKPALETIARMLGMPYIRALEVATFYTMFHLSPVGRRAHIQVCGTTPCMLRGAEELIAVCKRRIAPHAHELSADGDFSWEEVECLGACVNAPMAQIFKDTYEDLTPAILEAMIDLMAAGGRPVPGPQIARQFSAPVTGLTSLTRMEPAQAQGDGAGREPSEELEAFSPGRDSSAPVPAGEPRTTADETSGGVPLQADQARRRGESISADAGRTGPGSSAEEAKQQEAGRPTATGRPDEEAARSRPTDAGGAGEGLAAMPHKPVTAEEQNDDVAAPGLKTSDELAASAKEPGTADSNAPGWSAKRTGAGAKPLRSTGAPTQQVGRQPPGLAEPRDGKADDLRRIKGIGPQNESRLHELGIWHYDQIASWTPEDVRWVNEALGFPNRVEREDWIGQARRLAEAGRTDG